MKHRDGILDLVRGVSALLVMLGHLRAFLFLDRGESGASGLVANGFYFVTGLGHQAVMVFFVLSGYFVGGSVMDGFQRRRFSWTGYGIARLSRLWTVLLPALLLTLALDTLGAQLSPTAYLGGFGAPFMSGPQPDAAAAHGWWVLVGNLFFVQTVSVPVYGTNGPLWSLANEFWYYVLFPLAVVGGGLVVRLRVGRFHGKALVTGACCLLLAAAIGWWLPTGLVGHGVIWLVGVGVWQVTRFEMVRRLARNVWWGTAGGCAFLCTLLASKTGHWAGSDWMVGISFALWMPALLGGWPRFGWWSRCSTGLSEVSYSLYVMHFPVLFFAAAVMFNGYQYAPGIMSYLWFALLAGGTLLISAGFWWVFERNTTAVRRRATAMLGQRR
jgi:peptidoglycan/LPS O-acetylase OafA/YrhL